ncbi:MAG: repressor LexA [Dehalococcoidia bacterium]|nr:repressor LexA [Dehalococcoidia bacterium]
MQTLSERQQDMLRFIEQYIEEHGRPPTNREIGAAVGIGSTSHVDYHLTVLAKKGYIVRERHTSRGLRLVHGPAAPRPRIRTVPVIGQIAAGQPIDAISDPSDVLQLSADQIPPDTFALRVRGKSMIEDLIDDGDLVVVEPTDTATDGDIVVALLTDGPNEEGEATLKRFYREGERIRLQPAHPTMEPIYADPKHVRLQGRAISIIRHLH